MGHLTGAKRPCWQYPGLLPGRDCDVWRSHRGHHSWPPVEAAREEEEGDKLGWGLSTDAEDGDDLPRAEPCRTLLAEFSHGGTMERNDLRHDRRQLVPELFPRDLEPVTLGRQQVCDGTEASPEMGQLRFAGDGEKPAGVRSWVVPCYRQRFASIEQDEVEPVAGNPCVVRPRSFCKGGRE